MSPLTERLERLDAIPTTRHELQVLGRTTVYRLLREGAFPVLARRAGRSWAIPTVEVLAYLGLEPPATSTTTTGGCGCGARVNTEEKARTVDGST